MLEHQPMRVQTACNLVVRLTWAVAEGHNHPRHTYVCVQDEPMAVTVATRAGEYAPREIRLIGADTSASAGRRGPWEPLELGGWISGHSR